MFEPNFMVIRAIVVETFQNKKSGDHQSEWDSSSGHHGGQKQNISVNPSNSTDHRLTGRLTLHPQSNAISVAKKITHKSSFTNSVVL